MKLSASSSSDGREAGRVGAVSLPHVQHVNDAQCLDRLAQRVAGQAELGGEVGLPWQLLPRPHPAGDDHLLDLVDRLIGQRHEPPPDTWSPPAMSASSSIPYTRAAVAANTAVRSASDRPATSRSASADNAGVVARQQADRPVRAEHDPFGAERAQYDIGEGHERRRLRAGRRLGDQPGQLAYGVGLRRERPDRCRPRLERAVGNRRLARVVENERQSGHRCRRIGGCRELMWPHDQVVAQASRGHRAQSADHVGAAQPVRIRLGLHLVPDAGKVGAARPGPRAGRARRRSAGEVRSVQPTTAATSGSPAASRQHLRRLCRDRDGLHEHRAGNAGRAARSGRRSSTEKLRRSGAISGPRIQGWSRTRRSHTWWCASMMFIAATPPAGRRTAPPAE